MKEKEIFETKVAKVWLGDDGISRVIFLPKGGVTLDEAKEIISIRSKLILEGTKNPVLVDESKNFSITRDARDHFSSMEATEITSALAFLVESKVTRLLVNFFIRINKSTYETKVFTSESKAIKWLKEFLKSPINTEGKCTENY